jgi:hypothetical protein
VIFFRFCYKDGKHAFPRHCNNRQDEYLLCTFVIDIQSLQDYWNMSRFRSLHFIRGYLYSIPYGINTDKRFIAPTKKFMGYVWDLNSPLEGWMRQQTGWLPYLKILFPRLKPWAMFFGQNAVLSLQNMKGINPLSSLQ